MSVAVVNASGYPPQSFQSTQLAFAAHMRDPLANPAPDDIEDRRMGIYRELVYNNIESFLSGGFPVLRSLLDDQPWHGLVRAFVRDYRCHTPYFLGISQEFITYLQLGTAPIPEGMPFALELVHYEWVELALDVSSEQLPTSCFSVEDGFSNDSIAPDELSDQILLERTYKVSPLAWRLSYTYPVHQISRDYQPEEALAEPVCLIVYRNRDDEIGFIESNPVTFRLLQLIESGDVSFGDALLQVALELGQSNSIALAHMAKPLIKKLLMLSVIF